MAQDIGAPSLRLILDAVPVTAPGSGDPVITPLPALPGLAATGNPEAVAGDALPVAMAWPERIRHSVAGWAGTVAGAVRRLWLHPDRVLHVLWHGKPESMAEHRAYVKSRVWVPKELTGKPAKVLAVAGILYHLLIARPLKAVARTVDAAAERPLRMLMLAAFILILIHILH